MDLIIYGVAVVGAYLFLKSTKKEDKKKEDNNIEKIIEPEQKIIKESVDSEKEKGPE
jgi:hypothetical protein